MGVVYVGLAPVAEEFLFRGFLLSALQKTRLGFWGSSLVLTLLWAALHFNQPNYAIATTAVAGLIFSGVLWVTGSIRNCIIAHSAFNAYSYLLYLIVLLAVHISET
jgi:membrane protease YdiL (CAAX protease family)